MSDFIPTPQEFAISMKNCITGDLERDHCKMDDLMVELLRQLGYGEAMNIFDDTHKWYA